MSRRISRAPGVIQTRGPKRRIEKTYSQLGDFFTNSQQTANLHVVDESKTLVRIVGELSVMNTDGIADALYTFAIGIVVRPKANTVQDVAIADLLDDDPPLQNIWQVRGHTEMLTRIGEAQTRIYKVDLKAMRKVVSGDIISVLYIASTTNVLLLNFSLKCFFKE